MDRKRKRDILKGIVSSIITASALITTKIYLSELIFTAILISMMAVGTVYYVIKTSNEKKPNSK